ncbi:hypothetical protein BOC42_36005 [Burkholderia pseudomallei]|nr:hypothetical protein BOC42_36005 [Burkholderia pseudomallei]ARL41292.1 hypothetical protein BOC49_36325 [Burkholderia pseudomallei]
MPDSGALASTPAIERKNMPTDRRAPRRTRDEARRANRQSNACAHPAPARTASMRFRARRPSVCDA